MENNRIRSNTMKRKRRIAVMSGFKIVLLLGIIFSLLIAQGEALVLAAEPESTRSSPKDTTPYMRQIVPEDYAPTGTQSTGAVMTNAFPGIFIVDVVVNNTNPNLTNTDTANDGETSIAVNPLNPNEIIVSAFSGGWGGGGNAVIYHTTNGGITWTRSATVPPPPGWPLGCPCDWAWDYGRNNELSAAILGLSPTTCPIPCGSSPLPSCTFDVVALTTTDPVQTALFNYFDPTGLPVQAQETNHLVAGSIGNADQPWLLVNQDPTNVNQDNVYVAYDDFNNTDGVDGTDMRVAVSYGTNPPNFTVDSQPGNAISGVNPGHRMANDPRTGYMYSLFQRNTAGGADPKTINYMLNRSTDGGATWTLNGSPGGIIVATANSTQPTPKFGTVNALLGGVDHAAVDPNTGDIYYVYGNRDAGTGNNRLAIRRIVSDGAGGVVVGAERFVNGQVQSAIPSVAVTDDGTVGVFYYSFDGFSSDDFPIFTAWLALSTDKGETFTSQRLLTFLSSGKNVSTDNRQRVLGDYMQMKALGNCFYGAFTGNGVPFGRPFANHDPIFFKVTVGPQIQVSTSVAMNDTCVGDAKTTNLNVCNTGNEDLIIQSITSSNPSEFAVSTPSSGYPVVISKDFCFPFEVRFTPSSIGQKSATLTIKSNDPVNPSVTVQVSGNGTKAEIRVTGSADFGNVCPGALAEKTIKVCNVGKCNLNVTSAAFEPACPDFALIKNPFPAAVSPDSCLDLVIRFTATSIGPKACNLVIRSDDPATPVVSLVVTANTPTPMIDVPPDLCFPPTVIQSVGPCSSAKPFPISNTGICNLEITNISIDNADFSISGLTSYPINLQPGHVVGEGDMKVVFKPTTLARSIQATISVTYVSDPITGATTSITRTLQGEGVRTGARVLVTAGGVPLAKVEKIQIQRITGNRNKKLVDTVESALKLTLQTVGPFAPCAQFQYQREYGTVSNPIMLLPGSYLITATGIVNGKRKSLSVGFNADTCTFNPTITINLP
jgi:hypothetical protein